jgi:hypothetical protein
LIAVWRRNPFDFTQDVVNSINFIRICLFQFAGRLHTGTTRASVVLITTTEAIVAACGEEYVSPDEPSLKLDHGFANFAQAAAITLSLHTTRSEGIVTAAGPKAARYKMGDRVRSVGFCYLVSC